MTATGKPLARTFADTALVLVGHGSTRKSHSSKTTYLHAERIRERNIFAEVREGFLKQTPALEDVLASVAAAKVSLVPFMAAKGYITEQVLAAKIARDSRAVVSEPVGTHPLILQTLRARLSAFLEAGEINAGAVTVLVVGHGTKKHRSAADQLRTLATALSETAAAKAVFLQQEPLLKDWREVTDAGTVIVMPLLMAGGLHGARDVPALLGLDPDDHGPSLAGLEENEKPAGPFELCGRKVYLSRPLGYEPVMTEIIIERALEST
jgi:sirohydrochlorin cobaltochelatase